jgi:hypothetical protein
MGKFLQWLLRTWRGRILLGLLLVLAVVGCGLIWCDWQSEATLRAAREDLDRTDPG